MFGRDRVYLDFAAAAPVVPEALRAFQKAVTSYGNPSAAHSEGRNAKGILETSRKTIAALMGAKADNLIFTSGATEANNLAILGTLKKRGGHILYLPSAHASVVETVRAAEATAEAITLVDGELDLEAFRAQLRPDTVLVVVDLVSSETGHITDTRAVKRILEEEKSGALLLVDASQAPCVENIERTRIAGDFISFDAGKVGGVRGIGLLLVTPGKELAPVMYGGGQERGLRSGTEVPALAAAFAAALTEAQKKRAPFVEKMSGMREGLKEKILAAFPDALVNEGKKQAPHILNISFPKRDTDYLAALLDAKGFSVSTRSACETDSLNGSRAVFALYGDQMRATSTLRISFGPDANKEAVQRFGDTLISEVHFLDQNTL